MQADLYCRYNSAVFETRGATRYDVSVVDEDFLEGGSWNHSVAPEFNTRITKLQKSLADGGARNPQRFQNLSLSECMTRYDSRYITDRRDIILVTPKRTWANGTFFLFGTTVVDLSSPLYPDKTMWLFAAYDNPSGQFTEYDSKYREDLSATLRWWACKDTPRLCYSDPSDTRSYCNPCNIKSTIANLDGWTIGGFPISYCLSELHESKCEVQFSLAILIIVMICNAIKALCMFLALRSLEDKPLVTIGDAIMSFLETPDKTTVGCCLLSKRDLNRLNKRNPQQVPQDRFWRPRTYFWFNGPSLTRWLLCIAL